MRNQARRILPPIKNGYELTEGRWLLISPQATTNLLVNPSWENAPNGSEIVVTSNGTASRVTTVQTQGSTSLKLVPTTAALSYVGLVVKNTSLGLVGATFYSWSFDIKGNPGEIFNFEALSGSGGSAGGTMGGIYLYRLEGGWQRIEVPFNTLSAVSLDYEFRITKTSATTQLYYTDAWQVEAGKATTYIDGDMPAGQWQGTIHNSQTYRPYDIDGVSDMGGRAYNLTADLGFRVKAIHGAGMPQLENVATPYGGLSGALYQRTLAKPRVITLGGRLEANSLFELQTKRQNLISLLAPDNAMQQANKLTLRYKVEGGGNWVETQVYYSSGMEGMTDNINAEDIALNFIEMIPQQWRELYATRKSCGKGVLLNANGLCKRTPSKGWVGMGGGGQARYIARGVDNKIYTAPTLNSPVYSFDGTTATAIGANVNADAYCILPGSTAGTFYLGGDFTNLVVASPRLVYYDGASYTAMSTGADGIVTEMVRANNGDIYMTGYFTTIGGVACNRIAKYSGGVFTPLGTGLNQAGRGLLIGKDGYLYVVGNFTTANGVAVTGVAKWTGATFTSFPYGGWSYPLSGIFQDAGVFIYVTTGGGLVKYNGTSWENITYSSSGGNTQGLARDSNNSIYSVAVATSLFSGILMQYLGNSWIPGDMVNQGGANSSLYIENNIIYLGGAGTAAETTDIPYHGTSNAYPQIVITGPGRILRIDNLNTGKLLAFNYTLLAGEVATLDLTPANLKFTSNLLGNVIGNILSGSDLTGFSLVPNNDPLANGANKISVLMTGTSAASKVEMIYKPTYQGVEGSVY